MSVTASVTRSQCRVLLTVYTNVLFLSVHAFAKCVRIAGIEKWGAWATHVLHAVGAIVSNGKALLDCMSVVSGVFRGLLYKRREGLLFMETVCIRALLQAEFRCNTAALKTIKIINLLSRNNGTLADPHKPRQTHSHNRCVTW